MRARRWIGRHKAKPAGPVQQRLDGGRLPLTAAARRAFVHPLQLGGDIPQRQLRIGVARESLQDCTLRAFDGDFGHLSKFPVERRTSEADLTGCLGGRHAVSHERQGGLQLVLIEWRPSGAAP
jgi:hypothetical protein